MSVARCELCGEMSDKPGHPYCPKEHSFIVPEDAAIDICASLSDILGRELTACEKHTMSVKAKYWFLVGMQKQHLIIQDHFKKLVSAISKP